MNFRELDLKDRTIRRVFHRILVVSSCLLWIVLSIIFCATTRYYDEDEIFRALSWSILLYITVRVLYWGVYWIIKGFQPQQVKHRRISFRRSWYVFKDFMHVDLHRIKRFGIRWTLRLPIFLVVGLYVLHGITLFTTGDIYDDGAAGRFVLTGITALLIVAIYVALIANREKSHRFDSDYDEDDDLPEELYMFRIVREIVGDYAFDSFTVLEEDIFLSYNLEQSKRKYRERAMRFLNTTDIDNWQECDEGFEVRHGDLRIILVTDATLIPEPDVTGSAPIRV